ncbi:RDD family protein [Actinoplanes palleronii]|uniref:RDD family protein n=1 Tax=Actinoplanes palleronii TaxID=113570 RepID=UPI001EF31A8C|nr:RDD family protein [Actinoplanes palleronii]
MAASANDTPAAPAHLEPAGGGQRLIALLIDWILCLLVASLYASPYQVQWPPVALLIVVNTVFIGLFAETPGMRLARIRCVGHPDGGRIGLLRGLYRALLLALLIPALIADDRGRGLHDRVAGSIVIGKPRG